MIESVESVILCKERSRDDTERTAPCLPLRSMSMRGNQKRPSYFRMNYRKIASTGLEEGCQSHSGRNRIGRLTQHLSSACRPLELICHLHATTKQVQTGDHGNDASRESVITVSGALALNTSCGYRHPLSRNWSASARKIQVYLRDLYDLLVSPSLISTNTDEVPLEVENGIFLKHDSCPFQFESEFSYVSDGKNGVEFCAHSAFRLATHKFECSDQSNVIG